MAAGACRHGSAGARPTPARLAPATRAATMAGGTTLRGPRMIVILQPHVSADSPEYRQLMEYLSHKPNIRTRVHQEVGTEQTADRDLPDRQHRRARRPSTMQALPCVERVVRVSEEYRVLGRHTGRRPADRASSTTACASARTRCTCSPACARSTRPSTSS
ncbi:MAG: hypothetical protein MZW92_45870 [Comamonadaceae bacterium]|nr:hypothetical protein [Comamonadaceae bacterium]